MARVFVTGGTGYAGLGIVAQLAAQGHTAQRLTRGAKRPADPSDVAGDLERAAALAPVVAAAEAVVHGACTRSHEQAEVERVDVAGTRALVDAWARGPFVYLSCARVYGAASGSIDERHPVAQASWLDRGKTANEEAVVSASGTGGRGPGIALRYGFVCAANPRWENGQFLGLVYAACRLGWTIAVESEEVLATAGAPFLGGADLGRAVVAALALREGGVFNVASGFCTWRELVAAIDRHAGTRTRIVVKPPAPTGRGELRLPAAHTELDCRAFARASGFQPSETLDGLVGAFCRHVAATAAPASGARAPRPGEWFLQFMEPAKDARP